MTLIIYFILLILANILNGLYLSIVWNWFMPIILGLPSLTIIQALALELIIHMILSLSPRKDKSLSRDEYLKSATIKSFINPLCYLFLASVIKLIGGF